MLIWKGRVEDVRNVHHGLQPKKGETFWVQERVTCAEFLSQGPENDGAVDVGGVIEALCRSVDGPRLTTWT